YPDILVLPDGIGQRMGSQGDGAEDLFSAGQGILHRFDKARGEKLHLAYLVDDHDVMMLQRIVDGFDAGPIKGTDIDPVLAYSEGAVNGYMCEDGILAAQCDNAEALP